MDSDSTLADRNYVLPIILIAAVLQGWALYALHWSLDNQAWPATNTAWLFAFYAVSVFVPLTAQFFANSARLPLSWLLVAAVCIVFAYFAWHQGAWVATTVPAQDLRANPETAVLLAFVLGLIWLMGLPFLQVRLTTGSWRPDYGLLFSTAWRNKFMLAEAALFTGLFWILLVLWQALFHMLGLNFFRELFSKTIFIYPVTSVVFGVALHLIGSVERLTSVLLEQLLNVLKWLAIVAGLLLVIFTLALIFKLPGMISSQDRPISAAWLLWLVACLVLLINAAYRDGTNAQPYPRMLGLLLRCAFPLMVVVALTALYAIGIRISRYGFTVERVWACVVALAGLAYAIGYSFAVRSKNIWMDGVRRVNIWVALSLIAILMLTLTPALSPYRIAANSQFRLATSQPEQARSRESDALRYLRFDAGRYGLEKLKQLAIHKASGGNSTLADAAQRFLGMQQPWEARTPDVQGALDKLTAFPAGTTIEAALLTKLHQDVTSPGASRSYVLSATEKPLGLFIDLNGDGTQEFVLMGVNQSLVYQKRDATWQYVGMLSPLNRPQNSNSLADLQSGNFSAEPPRWRELRVGEQRFRFEGEP